MSNIIKRESLISRAGDVVRPKRTRKLRRSVEGEFGDFDSDAWLAEQHGEDYRYSRGKRHIHAKLAYQAAAAIAHQKVTHKPFYMEDLGKEEPAMPEPPMVEESAEYAPPRQYMKPTRFYPDGGQNDSVSRVQGVGRVQMQRIYPSYELSTSETRESGLGPGVEMMEGYPQRKKKG